MRKTLIASLTLASLFLGGCTTTTKQVADSSPDAAPPPAGDANNSPKLNAEMRFAAGQLAESQGRIDVAIDQYHECLKLEPQHLGALYRLGVLNAQLKRYPEAVTAWTAYVTATDGSAFAYSNLGFCDELSGQGDAAETAYLHGIAKDPQNLPCRVNYGLLLARKGRVNEAIRQWQFVLTPAEVHYNLGSVYQMEDRKEEARVEYNEALKLNGRFNDAKLRLAALDNEQPAITP
jgi:tetratricopeptide (TPR) repeat protein